MATSRRLAAEALSHIHAQVAFGPDGTTLAAGSCEKTDSDSLTFWACVQGEVRSWDAATGRPRYPFLVGHNDLVSSVAFSPRGRTLRSVSEK